MKLSNDRNPTYREIPSDVSNSESPFVRMAKELEHQKKSMRDIVASTKDIVATQGTLDGNQRRPLELAINGKGVWPLTEHGHNQLAMKCGIPERYYWAMLDAGMTELTANNVNAWLSKQADKRLLRIADVDGSGIPKVRALLSDRYRPLDNFDLAMLTMERAKEHGAWPQECHLSETRMYIKLVVPSQLQYLTTPENRLRLSDFTNPDTRFNMGASDLGRDPHVPGLIVSNSEVGDGAFRVEPFVYRLVCSNGLIGTDTLYKIHLGSKMEIGELFKDDTRQLLDKALWSQVRDIIDGTFKGEIMMAYLAKIHASKLQVIEEPKEVVDVAAKNLSLSDEKKLSLLQYFSAEGNTLFGLTNGITRLAQDFENYEDKIRLERFGGQILEKPELVIAK